jgi:hypothetical protein
MIPEPRRTSMPPEPASRHQGRQSLDWLTDTLFKLASDQDVRVIEALAAVLVRRLGDHLHGSPDGLSEAAAEYPHSDATSNGGIATRRAICQRIARRALRGSLVDPTRGATAVHRVDVSPAWSRNLLPTGMFGPFLFYQLTPGQLRACDWRCAQSLDTPKSAVSTDARGRPPTSSARVFCAEGRHRMG